MLLIFFIVLQKADVLGGFQKSCDATICVACKTLERISRKLWLIMESFKII